MSNTQYVSVHGGHSGQFCHHAEDMLEEIINKYIRLGYYWIGITEHVPGISDELLYPDQQEAGFTPEFLLDRFSSYMKECKRLKKKYENEITIYAAMEIETYSGYDSFVTMLLERFQPDYIVGSVHFVDDLGFDYSARQYKKTAEAVGGVDEMYCRYFDLQYDMVKTLKPAVVGHFDLIRIFDPEYPARLKKPRIHQRVIRNLELIKELDLILDFNLRSLNKGADEPYIAESILQIVKEMGVLIAPGDDSHGLDNVHQFMDQAIKILQDHGFTTDWPKPRLYSY